MVESALLLVALAGCSQEPGLAVDRLPRSTSTRPVPDPEGVLVVTRDDVSFDGSSLGAHDALFGGDAKVVEPVRAILRARAEQIRVRAATDPGAPSFRGAVSLQIDRDLPASTLLQLVHTAARAEFVKPWLVVADRRRERAGIAITLPDVAAAGAARAVAEERTTGDYANPAVRLDPERGYVVSVHDRVVDPGSGLVVPCPGASCDNGWPAVELNRLARRIKLDHPTDRAVVITPEQGVALQPLVDALDATRHDALAGRGSRELFPDAILARPEAP